MKQKAKVNEQAVVSELRSASVFFQRPEERPAAPQPPAGAIELAEEAPVAGTPPGVTRPSDGLITRGEGRRRKKRHPFEFYEDQLATLKQWSLEEQLGGGEGSMSEMVREALDAYIAKRRNGTDAL